MDLSGNISGVGGGLGHRRLLGLDAAPGRPTGRFRLNALGHQIAPRVNLLNPPYANFIVTGRLGGRLGADWRDPTPGWRATGWMLIRLAWGGVALAPDPAAGHPRPTFRSARSYGGGLP